MVGKGFCNVLPEFQRARSSVILVIIVICLIGNCKVLVGNDEELVRLRRQSGQIVTSIELDQVVALGQVDTGCSSLVIHSTGLDRRVANLRTSTKPILRFGTNTLETYYQDFPVRMFGGQRRLVNVMLADRSSLETAFGVPKDALIGMACIRSLKLRINVRDAIFAPQAEGTDEKENVVQLEWSSISCPIVSVRLPVLGMQSVMLDTGYDGWLSLSTNRIEQLVRAKQATFLEERPMWTPSGVITIKVYVVRHIDFAGKRFHNVPVTSSHVETIGLGLLQHFDMTLDFPNSRASFVPLDIPRDQMPLDASGLRVVFRESDRLIIRRIVPDSPAEKAVFKEGDRVLDFAGREPAKLWRHEIQETLAKAGETIHLKIERDGRPLEIDLPLSRPYQYPPEWPPEPPEFNPDAVPESSGRN